ncbi:hypothetical protein GAPWK_1339 [Gilliamella apicola]|nr:hypothetical protein GAPWK_1339 [Gilliamella apicola]
MGLFLAITMCSLSSSQFESALKKIPAVIYQTRLTSMKKLF